MFVLFSSPLFPPKLHHGLSRSVAEETAEVGNIVVVHTGSHSTGTGSLNPYHSSSYNYSFNSRYISLGLTWRIGRMELEEKASQSRVMKQH